MKMDSCGLMSAPNRALAAYTIGFGKELAQETAPDVPV
jgi:hypothetical protein